MQMTLRRKPITPEAGDYRQSKKVTTYSEIASRLGVVTVPQKTAALKYELECTLRDLGVMAYPWEKVNQYMDKKCREAKNHWFWVPLRGRDNVGLQLRARSVVHYDRFYSWLACSMSFGGVRPNRTPYRQPIPLPVLMRIDEIQEALPNAAFYVSDTAKARERDSRMRDPFLGVTLPGLNDLIVIERWNEPEFRI